MCVIVGIPGCGGLLTSNTGQFSSPQHPETYANNLDCEWLIRVPQGDRIELDFLSFDVERHRTCLWVEKDLESESDPKKMSKLFFLLFYKILQDVFKFWARDTYVLTPE